MAKNTSPRMDKYFEKDEEEDWDPSELSDFFDAESYIEKDDVTISESTFNEFKKILMGPFQRLSDPSFQDITIPGEDEVKTPPRMYNEKMSHLVLLLFTEQGYLAKGRHPYVGFASPEGNNRTMHDADVYKLMDSIFNDKSTALQMYTESYSAFPYQVYYDGEKFFDDKDVDDSDYFHFGSVLDRKSSRHQLKGKRYGPLHSERIRNEYKRVSSYCDNCWL